MAVDEEEAALRDENRSEVYILSNPGTMSTQRHSLQSRTATLAPQPAPAHVVDPVTHLAGYPGVFVADVRSSTYFCLVCKENLPGLFNAAFEHNTHLHVTTGKHARIVKDRRESGGGLARFGIGAAAEMDVAGATMPTLSRKQHECCGYWRSQCRIGGVEYDMSLLAGRDGAGFYFSQLLPRSLETAAPGVAAVVGTSVSVDGSTGTVVSGASDWAGGMLVSFGGGSTGSTSGGTGSLSSSSSSSSSSTGQQQQQQRQQHGAAARSSHPWRTSGGVLPVDALGLSGLPPKSAWEGGRHRGGARAVGRAKFAKHFSGHGVPPPPHPPTRPENWRVDEAAFSFHPPVPGAA